MLPPSKLKTLLELIDKATKEELVWMNSYLNDIVAKQPEQAVQTSVNKITIAYGTETGNSKKLATEFAAKAKKIGIHANDSLIPLRQHAADYGDHFLGRTLAAALF